MGVDICSSRAVIQVKEGICIIIAHASYMQQCMVSGFKSVKKIGYSEICNY